MKDLDRANWRKSMNLSQKQTLSWSAEIRISVALSLLRHARFLALLIAPELKNGGR